MFFDIFVTTMEQRVPRSLLLVEMGTRPAVEIRRGFLREGFKVDTASGLAHAQIMVTLRIYAGSLIFGATAHRLRHCVNALARCNCGYVYPIICIADVNEKEEVDILEAGGTLCLSPATPFTEILARLRAIFDVAEGFPAHFRIHDLGIDPLARRASRGGRPLSLSRREFDLLLYLAEHVDRPVSSLELHSEFWPRQEFSNIRVAVHIHKLRRAIGAGRREPLLQTVRGGGYRLCAERGASSLAAS